MDYQKGAEMGVIGGGQLGRVPTEQLYAERAQPAPAMPRDDVPTGPVVAETIMGASDLAHRVLMITEKLTGVAMLPKDNTVGPNESGALPQLRARAYEAKRVMSRAHDALSMLEHQLGVS